MLYGRVSAPYTNVLSNTYHFVRPLRHGPARYAADGVGFADTRDTYGTTPLISDYIFYADTPGWNAAHSDGGGLGWPYRGSNSLWEDGHVEWHKGGGAVAPDIRYRLGHIAGYPGEGYTQFWSSPAFVWWGKPGRKY